MTFNFKQYNNKKKKKKRTPQLPPLSEFGNQALVSNVEIPTSAEFEASRTYANGQLGIGFPLQ